MGRDGLPRLLLEIGAAGEYGNIPFELQATLTGKGYRTLSQSGSYSSKSAAALCRPGAAPAEAQMVRHHRRPLL